MFCWTDTYWSFENYTHTSASRQVLEGQYDVLSSLRHRFFKNYGDDDDDDDRNLYHSPQDSLSCMFTCMNEYSLLN